MNVQQPGKLTCGFPSAPWGVSGCPGCPGLASMSVTSCLVDVCCLETSPASGGLSCCSSACAETEVCVRVVLVFSEHTLIDKSDACQMPGTVSLQAPCPLQQLHIIQP